MILGFCFSFPTRQTAIDRGTLIKWVKGFSNPGAEGEDVMQLLRDAFHRKVRILQLQLGQALNHQPVDLQTPSSVQQHCQPQAV